MKSPSRPAEVSGADDDRESQDAASAADRRRLYWRAALLLVFWPLLGVAIMAWGFQMDDPELGRTVFNAGVIASNLGIAGTLVWAYLRWEGRD